MKKNKATSFRSVKITVGGEDITHLFHFGEIPCPKCDKFEDCKCARMNREWSGRDDG